MEKGNSIKITQTGVNFEVFIDGMKVERVDRVEFEASVGEFPKVLVGFYPKTTEIEGGK